MRERILAALVGLLIILPALIFGGQLAAEIVVGLVLLIGLDEYVAMAFPEERRGAFLLLSATGLGIYAAALHGSSGQLVAAVVLSAFAVMLRVLFQDLPVEGAANRLARYTLGLVWIPSLVVFLPLLRGLEHGMALVFFSLGVTWLGDTGGYFAGRFFGKHKLYERISPKKTWEGVAGGVVLAVVAGGVIQKLGLPQLGFLECLVLAFVLDIAGVVGDLVESMLKRSFGVKDSGWIMPGHGGILDRIDGVLFTAPLLYLYVVVVRGL
jgi:phosphatidate cytidylyltransferase